MMTVPPRPAAQAVLASTALTESRSAVVVETCGVHVAPPSAVLSTTPPPPTAHAVAPLTADIPKSVAPVPVGFLDQESPDVLMTVPPLPDAQALEALTAEIL
jgi:hypothetical protein